MEALLYGAAGLGSSVVTVRLGFHPWLRSFHMLRMWEKKEKEKKRVDCEREM